MIEDRGKNIMLYNKIIEGERVTDKLLNNLGFTKEEIANLTESNRFVKENQGTKEAEYKLVSANPLIRYGYALFSNNKLAQAINCFEKCLEIDPGKKIAAFCLFQLYIRRNEIEKGFEYFELIADIPEYQADYNVYLSLLDEFTTLPEKYKERIKNITPEDVLVPTDDKRYTDPAKHNEIRNLVFYKRYQWAIKKFDELLTETPNDNNTLQNAFIKDLLSKAGSVTSQRRERIGYLIRNEEIDEAERILKEREKTAARMFNYEVYTLKLIKTYRHIKDTFIIPLIVPPENVNSSAYEAIDRNDYAEALRLSRQYHRNVQKVDNVSSMDLMLVKICNLIKTINAPTIETLTDTLENNDVEKAAAITKRMLLEQRKAEYISFVKNLIIIGKLTNSYTKVYETLSRIKAECFEHDINEYIKNFYQALDSKDIKLATAWFDVLACVKSKLPDPGVLSEMGYLLNQARNNAKNSAKPAIIETIVETDTPQTIKAPQNAEKVKKASIFQTTFNRIKARINNFINTLAKKKEQVEEEEPVQRIVTREPIETSNVTPRKPVSPQNTITRRLPVVTGRQRIEMPKTKCVSRKVRTGAINNEEMEKIKKKCQSLVNSRGGTFITCKEERVPVLLEELKKYPNIVARVYNDGKVKRIILKYQTKEWNADKFNEVREKLKNLKSKPDEYANTCLDLLEHSKETHYGHFAPLAFAYLKMRKIGKAKEALRIFQVATGIKRYEDILFNLENPTSRYDMSRKSHPKMSEEDFIEEDYGIDIEAIKGYISDHTDCSFSSACEAKNLNQEETQIAKLLLARELYEQGYVKEANKFYFSVVNDTKESPRVSKLLDQISVERKLASSGQISFANSEKPVEPVDFTDGFPNDLEEILNIDKEETVDNGATTKKEAQEGTTKSLMKRLGGKKGKKFLSRG